MIKLYEYLRKSFENITSPIRDLWYSLVGFFYSINPLTKEDKLNFTTYYWKLTGKKNSSVSQFKVDSIVALELKNQTNLYSITNVGTADLNVESVEEYPSAWKITGNLILKLNETNQINVKNKTIFVGRQI